MGRRSLQRHLGESGVTAIQRAVENAERSTSAEIAVFIREWTTLLAWVMTVSPARVRQAAEKLFIKYGLDRTRDRNAIMIYVSLKERVAVVLGDLAINQQVDDQD